MPRKKTSELGLEEDGLEVLADEAVPSVQVAALVSVPKPLSTRERLTLAYQMVQIAEDDALRKSITSRPGGVRTWQVVSDAIEREADAITTGAAVAESLEGLEAQISAAAKTVADSQAATLQYLQNLFSRLQMITQALPVGGGTRRPPSEARDAQQVSSSDSEAALAAIMSSNPFNV